MKVTQALLSLLFSSAAYAAVNGRCSGSKAVGEYKDHGICISKSKCNSYKYGHYINNACPNDGDDIKCCVIDGCTQGLGFTSWCDWTSHSCPGTRFSGMLLGGGIPRRKTSLFLLCFLPFLSLLGDGPITGH